MAAFLFRPTLPFSRFARRCRPFWHVIAFLHLPLSWEKVLATPLLRPYDSTHKIAAPRDLSPVYVRFGSQADVARLRSHVRFTPESGDTTGMSALCRLCCKSCQAGSVK